MFYNYVKRNSNECNIKNCKSISLETGRFITEIIVKSVSQPYPTISDQDILKLGKLLNNLNQNCSIDDIDMNRINKYYSEIQNIYPTASGSRQGPPLSDLMDSIYSAKSKCKPYQSEG